MKLMGPYPLDFITNDDVEKLFLAFSFFLLGFDRACREPQLFIFDNSFLIEYYLNKTSHIV